MKLLRLPGPFKEAKSLPEECENCSGKHFFVQPDFRRSTGLSMVVIASIATCILFYFKYSWLTVWSPMFLALILDRIFAYSQPLAAVCYECQFIYRSLPAEELKKLSGFDLEKHDRILYAQRDEKS